MSTRAGHNIKKYLLTVNKTTMKKKAKEQTIMERLKTFADVCAATGKNEQDYIVPDAATDEEKAALYLKRVKLIAKALNGDRKVSMADTSQRKYYPWFRVIPDGNSPGGFRLSFFGYDCDDDYSSLGVRPYFLESEHATYAGEQWQAEFEAWAQYEDLSNQ